MQKQYQQCRAIKGFLPVLVCFYLLALVQLPLLEIGHLLSHSLNDGESKGHRHLFFKTHQEENSLKSLVAMAGHDHNMLETLKLVLELEDSAPPTEELKVGFKLDKHVVQPQLLQKTDWQHLHANVFRFILPRISSPIIGQEIPPPEFC